MNYPLRFTSSLWHNGETARQYGCEDPDLCALPTTLGSGGQRSQSHSACGLEHSGMPGQTGNPPISSSLSHLEQSPQVTLTQRASSSFSLDCEDQAEVRVKVGLLKDSPQSM